MQISPVQTAPDRTTLYALLAQYVAGLPPHLRHGVLDDETFAKLLQPPHGAFIARREDESIGCIFLRQLNDTTAIVQRLYVTDAARGLGAGRALVLHVIEEARAAGYQRIVLDTDATELKAAYQLYVSLGFRACEPFMEVTYDDATFMELKL